MKLLRNVLLLLSVIIVSGNLVSAQSFLNIVKTDNTKKYAALSNISKMTFSADGSIMQLSLKAGSVATEPIADIRHITFDATGDGTVLAIQQYTAKEKTYSLMQNYPNPFNPSTQIKFSVADKGLVTLKIYDVLGNTVKTLINEEKPAGEYTVQFDAKSFASGVYFYVLHTGNFSMTKKMLLIK
jgi:hypothetical protein